MDGQKTGTEQSEPMRRMSGMQLKMQQIQTVKSEELQPEKKDTVEKEFMSYPDIVSDMLNVLLYQGSAVTKAENLLSGPTETVYQGKQRLRSQQEDLSKYVMKDGKISLMYLISNQTKTDGKMVLRKAGYTGGVYRDQYEGKLADIFPVIQVVLYWGMPRWKGSRSLKQFLKRRKLLGEEWKYVDEIRLHVFEMRHLPKETRALFQSDMRIIVDYLAGEDIRSCEQNVVHKAALVKMLGLFSGETDLESIVIKLESTNIREEDNVTMKGIFSQVWDEGKTEGIKEGKREGIEEGKREGKEEGKKAGEAKKMVECIEKAMKKLNLTLEETCDIFDITVNKYEEAKKLI